jgi:hypothetical protein
MTTREKKGQQQQCLLELHTAYSQVLTQLLAAEE